MSVLSVCVEMLFNRLDFCERLKAVAAAGLSAAEIWSFAGRSTQELKSAVDKSGVLLSAMCVSTRNSRLAESYSRRALLCDDSPEVFAEIVGESLEEAHKLGVGRLIVTTGQLRDDISAGRQRENLVRSLAGSAKLFEQAGVTAVLEPLNTKRDHKGYFLPSSDEAFAVLREVSSPNVKLLFDVYHQQITEGDLITNITENIGLIGHFHIADNPGRHEPGTGEINYKNVFAAIASTGYSGFLGLEFTPLADDVQALEAVKKILEASK